MVPTLLYGLTTSADPAAGEATGIDGAPVRTLVVDSLCAIVSTAPAKPPASIDAVRVHDAVLQSFVMAGATVAAVRFGQLFDDDDACRVGVRERGERIRTLLAQHRGCVEMRVLLPVAKASGPRPVPAGAGPGRAYLESLKASGDVAPHVGLAPMIGPTVRAERVEGFASAKGTRGVAFAHLVSREDVATYRETVRALPSLADARVVGPLPLYSFADPLA